MTEQPVSSATSLQNVWNYFVKEADGSSAACILCNKSTKTKSGNTTGLHLHLKSHDIQARKVKRSFKQVESVPDLSVQFKRVKSGDKLASEMSLHAMLARMTSKSGLTFNVFATDDDLRFCVQAGLDKLGNNEVLPNSDKTIKSYVMSYGEKVKNAVHESFKTMKSKGIKFSLTFDEWTSIANRRYINVIVFGPAKMFWNLGLIKITGRATAYRIMELILGRLYEYSIDFNDDIVSITTDGASTMTKLGKDDSLAQHHLCLIHGIHLSVTDLLYAKPKRNQTVTADESDLDEELSDPYDDNDDDENDSIKVVELEPNSDFHDVTIRAAIKKIRDLGSYFKKSPPNNEILQSYVQQEFNNPLLEMPMLVDSKTRWTSLYEMLNRYWRIKDCLDKTLIDIKSKVTICPKEKYIISCILITLRPVMEVVHSLSSRDSTLVQARVSIIILFKQLLKQTISLTKKFVRRLFCRIKERWTINYAVLTYLHTGSVNNDILKNSLGLVVAEDTLYDYSYDEMNECNFLFEETDINDPDEGTNFLEFFKIPHKTAMKSHIVDLVKRLYQPVEDVIAPQTENVVPGVKSFREILNEAIMEVETNNIRADTSELSQLGKDLTSELNHFERTKTRIGNVLKIYDCLMTTKPTSVESERAFSLASYLCGKLRSRLNDSTLDILCFLRSFFRHPYIFEGNENL